MKKKIIYLAGPLFTHAELEFNLKIRDMLVEKDFEVFLPQEDTPDEKKEHDRHNQACIFQHCVMGIDRSDLVVAVLDGADVDSGTAWEIGYAYAKGKPVIGFRTDFRELSNGNVNLMIEVAAKALTRTEKELMEVMEEFR